MECPSKLIPILRSGVEVVKMICFKELKGFMVRKFPEREPVECGRLAAMVINDLFDTPNPDPAFVALVEENRELLAGLWPALAAELPAMLIPLTDALRISVLCDHQEGLDSAQLLLRAQEHGMLLAERELSLPNNFVELVRKLGSFHGIVLPPPPEPTAATVQ